MIEENIRLVTLAAAIYMKEDGTAIFIFLAVFLIKAIDFIATLAQACHLVQRDGRSHASLPFAVSKVTVVTNAVFGILNDNMYLGSLLHQVTGKSQSHIIRILVFVQFDFAYSADSSRIRAAMTADNIETSTLQTIGSYLDVSQLFSEQRFIDGFLSFCRRSFGRRFGRCTGSNLSRIFVLTLIAHLPIS